MRPPAKYPSEKLVFMRRDDLKPKNLQKMALFAAFNDKINP